MAKNPLETLIDNMQLTNIAETLDETEIGKIAKLVASGYNLDLHSMKDWITRTEEGIKIAEQVMEVKNFPWPGAANVKFPLIAISSIQFAARAYPAIVQGKKVVKAQVVGKDPDNVKAEKAERVSTHMSWQLLEQMEGWDEDTDKLLHVLPVVGTVFRKTYRDELNQVNASELCMPLDVIVHMDTKNYAKCRRVTHKISLHRNEVMERELSGLFRGSGAEYMNTDAEEDLAEIFLEQHRWLDLDGDGYEEPYIVTTHEASQTLVRIVARYDMEGIHVVEEGPKEGKAKKIDPVQYFTPFFFLPSPSGKFYAQGFAHLLGGINESLSTITNQLLDAGTLANLGGGFLGNGARMGKGQLRFTPGEWKPVETTGGVLRDNLVPLPVREPSSTLFQLLGMLNDLGMKLASVSDQMAGESPSQNTPATTTLTLLEEGMRVFTAIYKRVFRSLKEEFKKLRRLNQLYLDEDEVFRVLDEENVAFKEDYAAGNYDVVPVADPNMASSAMRLVKTKALMETLEINPTPEGRLEILEQYYEALQAPNIDKLLPKDEQGNLKMPQPPPDPKALELQLKTQVAMDKEEKEKQTLPLTLQKIEEEINLLKANTRKALADADSKPLMDQLTALNASVAALHKQTDLDLRGRQMEVAVNERPGKEGGAGAPGGMGAAPSNSQSPGVAAGGPGGTGSAPAA